MFGNYSNSLKFTILQAFSNDYCNDLIDGVEDTKHEYNEWFPEKINQTMICSGSFLGGQDSCQGEVICNVNSIYHILKQNVTCR